MLLQAKVTAANKIKALGIATDKLTVAQLKILLAPLKRIGDRAMPTNKKDLNLRLIEWEARGGLSIEEEVAIVVKESVTEQKRDAIESEEPEEPLFIEI